MPEGDTLFRTAHTLQRALAGKIILGFETTLAPISQVLPRYPMVGRTVLSSEAKGKWCLLHFSEGITLLTHMKMSGSWHIYRKGERWQRSKQAMRVCLETDDFIAVAFDVPVVELHTKETLASRKGFSELGPDVLTDPFDEGQVIKNIQRMKNEEIGEILLNQYVLAGIGNIYKSEICFVSRIHPFAKVSHLSLEKIQNLLRCAKKIMRVNIVDGIPPSSNGIFLNQSAENQRVISFFGERQTTGSLDPREKLWVYGRQGKPCRLCGSIIEMRKQGFGARVTFFCSQCQKE